MSKRKLRERIAALEARVVALEARPQPFYTQTVYVPSVWSAPAIDLTPTITCTALPVAAVPGGAS